MRSKSQVLQVMKQFGKEPAAFVLDRSGEKTSYEVKLLWNDGGIALRVLEEGIPWANLSELHIDLIKEESIKFMKEVDSTLVF